MFYGRIIGQKQIRRSRKRGCRRFGSEFEDNIAGLVVDAEKDFIQSLFYRRGGIIVERDFRRVIQSGEKRGLPHKGIAECFQQLGSNRIYLSPMCPWIHRTSCPSHVIKRIVKGYFQYDFAFYVHFLWETVCAGLRQFDRLLFLRLLRLASAAEEAEAKQEEQSFKSVCFHRDSFMFNVLER